LKQDPLYRDAWNNLAMAYQQTGDPPAQKTAEDAVKLAPGNPFILDTLGWILVDSGKIGDPARGVAVLRQALAKAPDARDIRCHLAAGLKKTGDLDGARKELAALMKGE
jgi:Tfp pilus assembly protein PilF